MMVPNRRSDDCGRTRGVRRRRGSGERRAVTVGDKNGGQIDVLSGVRPGERVIIDAPATMKDGDRIKVQ